MKGFKNQLKYLAIYIYSKIQYQPPRLVGKNTLEVGHFRQKSLQY